MFESIGLQDRFMYIVGGPYSVFEHRRNTIFIVMFKVACTSGPIFKKKNMKGYPILNCSSFFDNIYLRLHENLCSKFL